MSLLFLFLFVFFLQLEDIAVRPAQLNPALNHVECVVKETEPPNFELPGVTKIFPHICWVFYFLSIDAGYFITVAVVHLCEERKDDVVMKGTLTFSLFLVLLGVVSGSFAISDGVRAGGCKMVYPILYVSSIILICIPGHFYRLVTVQKKNLKFMSRQTSVYLGSFVMIHSILWMLVGMITEPYWAIPVVTSLAAAVCFFYPLFCFFHSKGRPWDFRDKFNTVFLIFLFISVLSTQLLLFFIGSPFFNVEIISSVISGVLIVIVGLWYKHFKHSSEEPGKESGGLLSDGEIKQLLKRSALIITEKSVMKQVINEAACSQVSTPA